MGLPLGALPSHQWDRKVCGSKSPVSSGGTGRRGVSMSGARGPGVR